MMKSLIKFLLIILPAGISGYAGAQVVSATFNNPLNISDTYVSSGTPSGVYSTATTVIVKVQTTTDVRRGLITFTDLLSTIPAGAVITAAELTLTSIATDDNGAISVQRLTSAFVPAITSWSSQPSATSSGQVTTATSVTGAVRKYNMQSLVQYAVTNQVNYGWLLRRASETTVTVGNSYYSADYGGTATSRPYLTVSWYIPFGIGTPNINNSTTTTSANGSIDPGITGGSSAPATYTWYDGAGTVLQTGTNSFLPSRNPGCYYLTATGSLGDKFSMAYLVGATCQPVNVTFIGNPDWVDDAMVSEELVGNAGNYGYWITGQGNGTGSWRQLRTYMRFRLWMGPVSPITANLSMVGTSHIITSSNASYFLRNTSDWKELTIQNGSEPTYNLDVTADIPATTGVNDNRTVDIANFWQVWRLNNFQNYGMRMVLTLPVFVNSRMRFYSSDAVTASDRPRIDFYLDDANCDRTSYTIFQPNMDAGYVPTFKSALKFYFIEEYKIDPDKKIPLMLLDENQALIAGITINGGIIDSKPLLPAFVYRFDDNREILDLSSYGLVENKIYFLQLTRSTGEKEYIKFQYHN